MKIEVRIFKTKGEGKTKAFANVTLGDAYVVRNLRVVDGDNGLFVAMPSEPDTRSEEKKFRDTFHPINKEAREALIDAVMAAYNEAE